MQGDSKSCPWRCRVGFAVGCSFFGGWLWFSPGVAHYGRSLISGFQEFFARIGKIFILAGGLRAGVSFYGL